MGGTARLTIKAPPNSVENYAVRLTEWESRRPIVLVPVRAGETSNTDVPLGRYRITIIKGRQWQGSERLFGRSSDVRETIEPMEFYRTGNTIMGHTIQLDSTPNGNMPMRPAER